LHDRSRPANRLARSSSPYLLLHQHNPVDWYPWGEEALARARAQDKPIFLSVGYSTCYWCHVMERESFSDETLAAFMNEHFVNIKLDREERPELDEIYMSATQLLTEQGGWPNSVFLFPDLRPFFAGTYFPPEDRYGRPGFGTVLGAVAEAWRTRRDELEEHAAELAIALRHHLEERGAPAAVPPPAAVAERGFAALARRFDATWGGFGAAPKFPMPASLFLLAELAPRRGEAASQLTFTLEAMARGGIYDQVAGGFHRYATDREWRVPHFEKMLYDNGLLLELYALEVERTGSAEAERIVRETAAFLERELVAPQGAFWSAIDAETHGHEGAYHVWTRGQIDEALGVEDATFLAPLYGFDGPPFFEQEHYVLHLPASIDVQAEQRRTERTDLLEQIGLLRERLRAARERRQHPATDDKVLTEWNGMAIRGFAVAGRVLGDARLTAVAARAADFLLDELRPGGGTLRRAWRGGPSAVEAFLVDYVYLIRGLLALHRATGARRWLDEALDLHAEQRRRLADSAGGYFNAAQSPDVLVRSKEVFDGATPSANAVAALNAIELTVATGEERWLEEAAAILRAFGTLLEAQPQAAAMMSVALLRYHAQAAGTAGESPGQAAAIPVAAKSAVLSAASAASAPAPPSVASASLALLGEATAGFRPFAVRVVLEPGWHAEVPSGVQIQGLGAEIRQLVHPAGRTWRPRGAAEAVRIAEGAFEVRGEVRKDAPRASLVLTVQPCDASRCLAPVEIELAVA
jgi:uncharacterized protein YyaL (SSP411 family)